MPAKNALKEYHENGYYHLYNRGVNKGLIYSDEQDYKNFLWLLKIYLSAVDLQGESLKAPPSHKLKNYFEQIRLIAYCLMPNHFHLMIWQKDPDGINHFMRSLATKYTMYFNRKYKRIGPLFQGVYKAVLVESEPQLLYLSKYIHRNPFPVLSAGSLLSNYKHSSYQNYLGLFNQPWIDKDDILGLFSKNPQGSNSYQNFVEETDERDLAFIKTLVLEEV
ncbi:hypothetical protein COW80_03265 [Candidatus Beckwithbacteria bacterium CG22_combo_CG10-13_8_21_14_all_01_47_9]|nr:MAG: hypothetical protein AUJ59_02875 [Candidatus Beckwithbacteria bacterium CG1_02_47_37]PIP87911.1 MAG: hypothetical protein COW80_03265 [Candidatus Beckwithbacteria bacterium CG22_combo_CG10-13_8_21_14_all_01_47_9]PJC66470.1 MAG: hypothetical protein CO018_01805 [Candidatus Beckwithbacteria bacterium CG_4_9_14_0_2_um_filter_47_11]